MAAPFITDDVVATMRDEFGVEVALDLIGQFETMLRASIGLLAGLRRSGDLEGLRLAAHTIRGTGANFGAARLAHRARIVGLAARRGRRLDVARVAGLLARDCEQTLAAYRAHPLCRRERRPRPRPASAAWPAPAALAV